MKTRNYSSLAFILPKWKRILFRITAITLTVFISAILGEALLRAIAHFNLYGERNEFTMFMKQFEKNTKNKTIQGTGTSRLSEDPIIKWGPIPKSSI